MKRLSVMVIVLVASALAVTRPDPPTFIVDAHGNPWMVESTKWIGVDEFGGTYVGMTVEPEHRIRLLEGRTLAQEQRALLHELMHVIAGVDHTFDAVDVHQCIYQFSEGLQALFAENPDLVRYLTQN